MKSGWKNVKLPELAKSIFAGGDVDKNNLSNEKTKEYPYPIYTNGETNNGLYGFTNIFRVAEPAITVSARGTIGFTCVRNEPYYPAVRLINIIPKDNVDINYLNYFIKSKTVSSSGASIPQLTVPMVKEFEIGIPESKEEQRNIVAKLDQAFAAIDQAKANIEKNIANAKELFQSKLNQIFSQKGEGWEVEKLSLYFDIKHGYAFDGKSFEINSDINLPIVLTPGNYNENGGLYFNEKNTKRAIGNYPDDFFFKKGDLTVVMTDLSSKMKILGLPALIDCDNILHNQRIGKFINKTNDIYFDNKFLFYFLMTKDYLNNIKISATGTMVKHTAPSRILKNVISYPKSIISQQQIVSQLEQLQEQTKLLVTKYEQKLANLEELKKSILEKAFKGELV